MPKISGEESTRTSTTDTSPRGVEERMVKKYRFPQLVSVDMVTEVEAESEEEARKLAKGFTMPEAIKPTGEAWGTVWQLYGPDDGIFLED